MSIDNKSEDEKLQYNNNTKAAKISTLSAGKMDKFECHAGEEILPFDQSRMIEQTRFTYSPPVRVFETQIKIIEEQGIKQVEDLEVLKPNTQKLSIKDAIT